VNQIYLGSIERIIELAQGGGQRCLRVGVEEFGALFIVNLSNPLRDGYACLRYTDFPSNIANKPFKAKSTGLTERLAAAFCLHGSLCESANTGEPSGPVRGSHKQPPKRCSQCANSIRVLWYAGRRAKKSPHKGNFLLSSLSK